MQNNEKVEGTSKMIAFLITQLDVQNGLYAWLLKYGHHYSLTTYIDLSIRFCQEKRPDISPSVLQKLIETQENLRSLHALWCCFWNTYERIKDDSLWKDVVEKHPLLTNNVKSKPNMRFTTFAWQIVVKIRNKDPNLNPWVLSLAAFSLLLTAMKDDPISTPQWKGMSADTFRESVDAYLLKCLYQRRQFCTAFPLSPPPGFSVDVITSLVTNIITTQVHSVNDEKETKETLLSVNLSKWLGEDEETAHGNLDPTILMTEYSKLVENGKGLDPFVFLVQPSDDFPLIGTGTKAPVGQKRALQTVSAPVASQATVKAPPIHASAIVAQSPQDTITIDPANENQNNLPRSQETLTETETTHIMSQSQELSVADSDNVAASNDESSDDNDKASDGAMEDDEEASENGEASEKNNNIENEASAQDDENKNDNGHENTPASDSERNSQVNKKQKLNHDDSRSRRLAAAMALIVKEIDREMPISATDPACLSESMELTEWTVSLLFVDHVAPSRKLSRLLEDAAPRQWAKEMIPTLNRTLLRFSQENLVDKATRTAPVSVTKSEGVVQIHGSVTDDKLMSKAVILLFYHALEAILTSESARLKVTSHPQIVLYSVFHKALLACCMWCVTKAMGVTQKLRASPCLQALSIQSVLRVCDSNPYDFLKVSESFVRVLCLESSDLRLGSPLPQRLPRLLQRDLQSIEVMILDSLLWSTSTLNGTAGSLPEHIEDFMAKNDDEVTLWPPEILAPTLREEVPDSEKVAYPTPEHDDFAEYRCVNFLIRSVVKLSFSRLEDICELLQISVEYPVVTQSWMAFRHLLRNHVDLLFDRHLDQWILCCLYGVAKALSYPLTFARIIEAYIKSRGPVIGDVTCHHIVRYIRMDTSSHDLTTGDIIALYNHVWVPTMKPYLLECDSLNESAKKVQEMLLHE